jgi:type IV secretory pathway VirB6-like protein
MQRSFLKTFLSFFCAFFIAVLAALTPHNSYAVYEGVRDGIGFNSGRGYDTNSNRCNTGSIAFDPFSNNKDIDWDLSNPTCIGYVASVGAVMMAADITSKTMCSPPMVKNTTGVATETAKYPIMAAILPAAILTPITVVRQVFAAQQCVSRAYEYAAWQASCAIPGNAASCSQATLSATDLATCCSSVAAYTAAVGAAISALAIIWDVARNTYENARVCGSEWQSWVPDDKVTWKRDKGPYRKCIEDLFLNNGVVTNCGIYGINSDIDKTGNAKASIENKFYREYIYGGREYEDKGDNSCDNPPSENDFNRKKNLGYEDEKQKYYMTGPGAAPVYACYRFLTTKKSASMQKAYDCCKRRSQNAICIENRIGLGGKLEKYNHGFCEIGSSCTIDNVSFAAYASKTQSNYVCAKTYSVCPYNHLLAGGTETKKVNAANTTLVDNFCQYMNHCSKIPILPYVRSSNLEGAFISASCKDLKGDSQNVYGYNSQLIPINTKNFSAPMAQCFKETLENLFLNVAGDTQCSNPDEKPNSSGVCTSGYAYQRGHGLKTQSFFLKVQSNLQSIIKMTLTLSIMFFGYMILHGGGSAITKKQLLPYILKIGLVMYFAVGDGWQYGFMKGVLGTSTLLSDIMFRVDESGASNTLDGCQFPRFNYADQNEDTKYSQNASYPPGSEYLRIWDTLDCKIARALGFGPEVSVPNLIYMILGGFFTGGLGIVFVVASFALGFFMISLTIRALHIFLLSITSIIILMYVSPIAITAALFDKTKNIFDGWWKQMLGFTLQPMILFAYLGILITLFDKIIIGDDVRFTGDGKQNPKQMICNDAAKNTSIICIFRIPDIKTYDGFEVLGVGLPMLGSMNQEKLQSIMKAALIMFIFMKFMDQITGFASKLVGGAELNSDWDASASGMAKNAYGTLRGIQQRGMRVGKAGLNTIMRAGGQAKSMIGLMGNKGKATTVPDKATTVPDKASGSDHQPTLQGSTENGSDHTPRDSQQPNDRLGEENSGQDNVRETPEKKQNYEEKRSEDDGAGNVGTENSGQDNVRETPEKKQNYEEKRSEGDGADNVGTENLGKDSGGSANKSTGDNPPTDKVTTDVTPPSQPSPPPSPPSSDSVGEKTQEEVKAGSSSELPPPAAEPVPAPVSSLPPTPSSAVSEKKEVVPKREFGGGSTSASRNRNAETNEVHKDKFEKRGVGSHNIGEDIPLPINSLKIIESNLST